MRNALICGKWELPFIDNPGTAENQYQYVESKYLDCRAASLEWLLQGVRKGLSTVSYFGGVGMIETIVEKLLEPSEFAIFDIDEACVSQLKQAFPQHLVEQHDAMNTMGRKYYDVHLIDHPFLTVKRWPEWQVQFDRVFNQKPLYVELAVSVRRLPLLRGVYGKILGEKLTDTPSYIIAISHKLQREYGYSVTRCAYHFASAYLLIESGIRAAEFYHVINPEKGFKYIDN